MLDETDVVRRGGNLLLVLQLIAIPVCDLLVALAIAGGKLTSSHAYAYYQEQRSYLVVLFFGVVLLQAWLLGRHAALAVYRDPARSWKIALQYAGISIVICTAAMWGLAACAGDFFFVGIVLSIATVLGSVVQLVIWFFACWRLKKRFIL